MKRRTFVGKAALAGLGTWACGNLVAAEKASGREFAVFTKFMEKLPFDKLAEMIAPLGIAGLEAPLRKGGHIEPEEMAENLPGFVAALAKRNLKVVIMASGICRADKAAEVQLRAAAAAGITRYRLEHLKYDLAKPLVPQIANFKAQLTDLAALNKDYKLAGKTWTPCPLGQGVVNPACGKLITKILPPEIPAVIHIEYQRGGDLEGMVGAMRKDLATARKWLG